MKVTQFTWSEKQGWSPELPNANIDASLIFLFGGRNALSRGGLMDEILEAFPEAPSVGCSTAGEIIDQEVLDDSVVVSAISFENATVQVKVAELEGIDGSYSAGGRLGEQFEGQDLKHVLVFSPGVDINGTELVQGLSENIPDGVSVSGGLSADGACFEKTLVVDRNRIGGNLIVLSLIHISEPTRPY